MASIMQGTTPSITIAVDPATGLAWDDETGKISIAPGFHADENGDVVKD